MEDGFTAMSHLGSKWKDRVEIMFVDAFGVLEPGVDGGGLFKEFLTEISKQAFQPNAGMWEESSTHQLFPRPGHYTEEEQQLELYLFLGQIIGKALYTGVLVNVQFADFFLSKWIGKRNFRKQYGSPSK